MKNKQVTEKEPEVRYDKSTRHEYQIELGGCLMPFAVLLGIITVGILVIVMTSCSKLDEQVREERIPLPQAQIDPPNPDWNAPSDIDGKHTNKEY